MLNQVKNYWTTTEIHRLFRINQRFKSGEKTIANAETKGLIPAAERIARGRILVRQWKTDQLPLIGQHFGFLKAPAKQLVIAIYTNKGGVLKTSIAHNLARILALNNIKVVVVDLDVLQETITDLLVPSTLSDSLEEINEEIPGLYHYFFEKYSIDNVIKKTPLPTLDIIPANPELELLNVHLINKQKREYYFAEKLIKDLSDYQVVIFDNGSGWNNLVINSLTAANNVIYPLGCSRFAYRSAHKNIAVVRDFERSMGLKWDNFIYIPTLLDNTALSNKIYGSYLNNYEENLLAYPIKHLATGPKASEINLSVFEFDPNSALADDYYKAITAIWSRINGSSEEI